jgi:type III secretion protein S
MDIADLLRHALIVVVTLSAPPLMVAVLLGVGISLVQSLFQVQDQTLAFAMKLMAVSAMLYLLGGWMESEILLLGNHMFYLMGMTGR